MTYRNLLLLGLSSIALQGCIAAAALPIVAGGGALVRNGVSDDARSSSRESVTVVNPPLVTPAAAPTPTPTPALAAAEPAEPVAAAAEPISPQATPTPASTPTPLASATREPVIVATLGDASQDALYVERYPGETKQSRRAALAQTRCVIALAGDERSDFDDLYNFLRDLNDARSLEMMLGNGWFLIPNPVGE